MRVLILALAASAFTAPAFAQQHDPACQAIDAQLPAGLEGWKADAPIATATGSSAPNAQLQLGKGYQASLRKKADVAFVVEPEKPGGSVSYSGLFAFNIETAGNYAVALGSAAWIDVVEDGKSLEPSSFGHGPACTTIRKKVVFALKPGRHLLQVAGNGAETTRVLIARQP